MNKLIAFGVGIALLVSGERVSAQSSTWVDMLSGALPRSTFPTPSTATPSASSTGNWGAPSYPGGYLNTRRDWKLGVGIQNNEVGAIVTTVAPGSAAQQAGTVLVTGPSHSIDAPVRHAAALIATLTPRGSAPACAAALR